MQSLLSAVCENFIISTQPPYGLQAYRSTSGHSVICDCRDGTSCRLCPMHGFIGIQALDLSRDTPSYLHSSNSLALCDTLVLGCHRVDVVSARMRCG
jgi:hypothetical protein|eukprot:COSAG01_NODE_9439_length_2446_cov_29.363443_3_plen_97_part_00